jgi:hypothetical protein
MSDADPTRTPRVEAAAIDPGKRAALTATAHAANASVRGTRDIRSLQSMSCSGAGYRLIAAQAPLR